MTFELDFSKYKVLEINLRIQTGSCLSTVRIRIKQPLGQNENGDHGATDDEDAEDADRDGGENAGNPIVCGVGLRHQALVSSHLRQQPHPWHILVCLDDQEDEEEPEGRVAHGVENSL